MKAIVCVVLLAATVLAAPEGKRDKRGYLHGGYGLSLGHGHDFSHGFGHDFGHSFGHDYHGYGHGAVLHAPAAKLVSYNKVVSVPKVVEVQKIVSVPKVVSVPEVVKVSKIVEAPHYSHYSHGFSSHGLSSHGLSSGWW